MFMTLMAPYVVGCTRSTIPQQYTAEYVRRNLLVEQHALTTRAGLPRQHRYPLEAYSLRITLVGMFGTYIILDWVVVENIYAPE